MEINFFFFDYSVCNEDNDSRLLYVLDVVEKLGLIDLNFSKENSLISDLVKILIICDLFLICNFNIGVEKFLDMLFVCLDISIVKDI